jgi:hypothetical protein
MKGEIDEKKIEKMRIYYEKIKIIQEEMEKKLETEFGDKKAKEMSEEVYFWENI